MVRRVAVLASLLAILLTVPPGLAPLPLAPAPAAAQETADLAAGLPEGIALETLVTGEVSQAPATPAQLRLERLTLAPGTATGMQAAPAPEALYVETGEVIVGDELGIEGLYAAGSPLFIPGGVSYAVRNDGASPATVLRLSPLPAASDTAGATPAADGAIVERETLVAADVELLPAAPARMFIARLTWEPGADLGENSFAGPIGVLSEQGVLTVAGPSGIEGQIQDGRGIIFPTNTANNQRNASADPVTTLVFGLLPTGSALLSPQVTEVAQIVPEPPVEDAADVATSTPSEEIAPEPEPTAEPTPLAPGVLCEADTTGGLEALTGPGWNHSRGMLVSDGSQGGPVALPCQPAGFDDYAIEVDLQIVRPNSDNSCDAKFALQGRLTDAGGYEGFNRTFDCWGSGYGIAAYGESADVLIDQRGRDWNSDWHTYRLELDGSEVRVLMDGAELLETQDNQFLEGGNVGFYAQWVQVSVRRITIEALGAASSGEAAMDVALSGDDSAVQFATTNESFSGAVNIAAMLPTAAELPAALVQTEDRERSLLQASHVYSDPADMIRRFLEWDWRTNVLRVFQSADAGSSPGGLTYLAVSIHEFGNSAAASEALDYALNDEVAEFGLQPTSIEGLGDRAQALVGEVAAGNDAIVYVQRQNVLVVVDAISPRGDPMPDALAVATAVLAK